MARDIDHLRQLIRLNPDDLDARSALIKSLRRRGDTGALLELGEKNDAARLLQRAGQWIDAACCLGIRWMVDLEALPALSRTGRGGSTLEAAVEATLTKLDLPRILEHFPKRADGMPRKNRTFYLQRFPFSSEHYPHRRLWLLTWTPGTASYWDHPEDRTLEAPLVTVELGLRSHRKPPWPVKHWQR